jgi:hypothetical protein
LSSSESLIDDAGIDGAENTVNAPVKNANQHPATPANQALGRTASLAIHPALAFIADSNDETSFSIGHVRSTVPSTEFAVAGSRYVGGGRAHERDVDQDVAAMTSAVHLISPLRYTDTMAEPTDEESADLRRIFESCDLDGDGFIDKEEFHSLLKKLDGDVSRDGGAVYGSSLPIAARRPAT